MKTSRVTRLLPKSPPSPLKIPCSSLPSKSSPPSGNHSRGSDSLRRRIRAGLGSVQLPLQIQVRRLPPPRLTLLSSAPPLLSPGFLLDTGGCSPPRSRGALIDCGGGSPLDPVAPRPCSTPTTAFLLRLRRPARLCWLLLSQSGGSLLKSSLVSPSFLLTAARQRAEPELEAARLLHCSLFFLTQAINHV